MENFPEITFEVDGKKMKSDDYGWEDKDFVAIDKETKKKYVFKDAYFSNMSVGQFDDKTLIVENVNKQEVVIFKGIT